jgi:hypothetical protein
VLIIDHAISLIEIGLIYQLMEKTALQSLDKLGKIFSTHPNLSWDSTVSELNSALDEPDLIAALVTPLSQGYLPIITDGNPDESLDRDITVYFTDDLKKVKTVYLNPQVTIGQIRDVIAYNLRTLHEKMATDYLTWMRRLYDTLADYMGVDVEDLLDPSVPEQLPTFTYTHLPRVKVGNGIYSHLYSTKQLNIDLSGMRLFQYIWRQANLIYQRILSHVNAHPYLKDTKHS